MAGRGWAGQVLVQVPVPPATFWVALDRSMPASSSVKGGVPRPHHRVVPRAGGIDTCEALAPCPARDAHAVVAGLVWTPPSLRPAGPGPERGGRSGSHALRPAVHCLLLYHPVPAARVSAQTRSWTSSLRSSCTSRLWPTCQTRSVRLSPPLSQDLLSLQTLVAPTAGPAGASLPFGHWLGNVHQISGSQHPSKNPSAPPGLFPSLALSPAESPAPELAPSLTPGACVLEPNLPANLALLTPDSPH